MDREEVEHERRDQHQRMHDIGVDRALVALDELAELVLGLLPRRHGAEDDLDSPVLAAIADEVVGMLEATGVRIVGVPHEQLVQAPDELGGEPFGRLRHDEVERILVAGELALAAVAERRCAVVDESSRPGRRDDDVLDRARRRDALEARLRREPLEHLRRLLVVQLLASATPLDPRELAHEGRGHGRGERLDGRERSHEATTRCLKVAHLRSE